MKIDISKLIEIIEFRGGAVEPSLTLAVCKAADLFRSMVADLAEQYASHIDNTYRDGYIPQSTVDWLQAMTKRMSDARIAEVPNVWG